MQGYTYTFTCIQGYNFTCTYKRRSTRKIQSHILPSDLYLVPISILSLMSVYSLQGKLEIDELRSTSTILGRLFSWTPEIAWKLPLLWNMGKTKSVFSRHHYIIWIFDLSWWECGIIQSLLFIVLYVGSFIIGTLRFFFFFKGSSKI